MDYSQQHWSFVEFKSQIRLDNINQNIKHILSTDDRDSIFFMFYTIFLIFSLTTAPPS